MKQRLRTMFLRAEIREGKARSPHVPKGAESSCNHLIDSPAKEAQVGLMVREGLTNRDGRAPSGYDRAGDQELFAQHF